MTTFDPRIPPEAAALLRDRRKIEAIKLTREKLGLSLKDAKDLCDAYEAADATAARESAALVDATTGALTPDGLPVPIAREDFRLPAAALEALGEGDKVRAIIAVREATGWALKPCKEIVEAALARDAALLARHDEALAARRAAGSGAGRLVLALLALGLIAAALYFSGVLG